MALKEKRIEYRVSKEFYYELDKYRSKFSMTMTQAITVLLLKALRSIDPKTEQSVNIIQSAKPVIQDNPKVDVGTSPNGNYQRFQEYMKRKTDPDMNEDDWNEILEEIKTDPLLNEFQRGKLLRQI